LGPPLPLRKQTNLLSEFSFQVQNLLLHLQKDIFVLRDQPLDFSFEADDLSLQLLNELVSAKGNQLWIMNELYKTPTFVQLCQAGVEWQAETANGCGRFGEALAAEAAKASSPLNPRFRRSWPIPKSRGCQSYLPAEQQLA